MDADTAPTLAELAQRVVDASVEYQMADYAYMRSRDDTGQSADIRYMRAYSAARARWYGAVNDYRLRQEAAETP